MEIKPRIGDSHYNFKQSDYLDLGGLLVVPENEFDNQIVNKMVKKLSGGGGQSSYFNA